MASKITTNSTTTTVQIFLLSVFVLNVKELQEFMSYLREKFEYTSLYLFQSLKNFVNFLKGWGSSNLTTRWLDGLIWSYAMRLQFITITKTVLSVLHFYFVLYK